MYTLKELESISKNCQRCDLSNTRTNVVFGGGNPEADIMFVGEGPGFHEDRLGEPFVGKSGQLFDKMLRAIELKRDDVYITNIIKCRPPNNRNPSKEESDTCIEYLRWQVALIKPKLIVCLGAVASKNMISKDFKITQQRGSWFQRGDYSMIGTYHPAALLRDPSKKGEAWEDFKMLKEKLELL